MEGKRIALAVLVSWFLCMALAGAYTTNISGFSGVKCIDTEEQALLHLKTGLLDYQHQLSSWKSGEDCCRWTRVRCNKHSGRVQAIDLRPIIDMQGMNVYGVSYSSINFLGDKRFIAFGGFVNSSALLQLQHLEYLDLSLFGGTLQLSFIASLTKLRYLNLSRCDLGASVSAIPYQLQNLSRLVSLDLSHIDFPNVKSLSWLSNLHALTIIDLSFINLSRATDWFQTINSLPSLLNLRLSGCQLSLVNVGHSLSHTNSSAASLQVIDLSINGITSSIFPWLLNFNSSLVSLDLYGNLLQGPIPDMVGALTSLKHLDLAKSLLEGEIPETLGNLHLLEVLYLPWNNLTGELLSFENFTFLRELHLYSNRLNGSLPESIWQREDLEVFDVSENQLHGLISDINFSKLRKLTNLYVSFNSFELNLSSNWIPPFQIEILGFHSCKMGSRFPSWLRTQMRMVDVDLSNTGISDAIGDWFWELPIKLSYLDLSDNRISGDLQKLSLIMDDFSSVNVSSNLFYGSIPKLPRNTTALNLSNNKLTGTAANLCSMAGEELTYLDLSNNLLSGELPDCWNHWKKLSILNLENNNFSGRIPASFGSLAGIEALHMSNNSFHGELPPSLASCTRLDILDIGGNRLSGKLPSWMGLHLSGLIVLRLRSNNFQGNIPWQLCQLSLIQILDISHNNLSGSIPECLSNFTAMAKEGGIKTFYHNVTHPLGYGMSYIIPYVDNVMVVWKGMEYQYGNTLGLVKSIDLSSNSLIGEIPNEITGLRGLVALNLSRNQLSGGIPPQVGLLKSLISLDLSLNKLSGELPAGLGDLTWLSHINISYNNFRGSIPLSTQLQSFEDSSYQGNAELCGKPLPIKCPGEGQDQSPSVGQDQDTEDEQELIGRGFYVSMVLGFAMGFWGVCGPLVLSRAWRHAFFSLWNHIGHGLFVTAAVNMNRLRRRIADCRK